MNAESTLKAELDVATDFARLSGVQRLAILLLMLSQDNAAAIMKSLEEQDLEEVSSEMVKLGCISQELQQLVLAEFSGVAVEAATAITGGAHRTRGLLEKSVGLLRASDIVGRVSPQRAPVEAMQQIVDMDVRHIFSLVRQEQLQTIVLVVSYLTQEKASQLLSMFRDQQREQIIERLATMMPTSVQVVENVAEALQGKSGTNRARALNQTGGVKVAAQVLNSMSPTLSKAILMSITERNAELGESILKKMFTFDELDMLDTKTIQLILQSVETRALAVALKSAPEKLKNTLLSCLSKRAADNLKEEMGFMGALRLTEIEAARAQILETVRRMESEGEISLEELRHKPRHS
jgi:flagellar motor switch protein FliG